MCKVIKYWLYVHKLITLYIVYDQSESTTSLASDLWLSNVVGHARIRGAAKSEHFPQENTKTPHITEKAVLAIAQSL